MDGDEDVDGQKSALDRWYSRSPEEIDQERRDAEQAGRAAYAEAIRTGQDVQARTPAELIALGRARLAQQQAVQSGQATTVDPQDCGAVRDALMQADTFARGMANAVTLNGADHLAAAGDALFSGSPSSFRQRYDANLSDQRARDAYDASHRRTAQIAGQVAGVGASFLDGMEAGSGWANGLNIAEKGNLGERMSRTKSWLQGDPAKRAQVWERLQNGKATVVDQINRSGRWGESKFGYSARPTPNQLQAAREQGPNYYFDRWYPHQIGYGLGGVQAGITGIGAAIDDER